MKKMLKTRFAGMIRRLALEEKGAVMMEYVIVAVMVAAAAAVAFWYFGRSVENEARVASHAVTADNTTAIQVQNDAQQAVSGQDDVARERAKDLIVTDQEDAADL